MISKDRMMELFQKTGAMLEGHFKLTSGMHSNRYFQCALVTKHPQYCQELCQELAARFSQEKIDLVVGPALGGIVMSYEMARALGVPGIFAEREAGKMTLRRGFVISPGQRVLVVEDVITTGGSVKEVIELVRELSGEVVGVGVLVNRSGGKAEMGVRTESLLEIPAVAYTPELCPLCRDDIPFVKPGSRNV